MHAHVHKEFFRNQDVSPSLFLLLPPPPGGGQCLGGGHISSTPGGGYWGWWQKILPSKNYHQCSGKARALLSLSLSLSFSSFLSSSSSSFFFSSPSRLAFGSFLRFPAVSSVSRQRRSGRSAGETSLWNPSSLGFQGLLLAAFNERKDKTYPPSLATEFPANLSSVLEILEDRSLSLSLSFSTRVFSSIENRNIPAIYFFLFRFFWEEEEEEC